MGNERGYILIFTFLVMIVLSLMTASFMVLNTARTKGSGYDIASSQALWLAEAGLQKAMHNILSDGDYSDIGSTNLGKGSYSVDVEATGVDDEWALESTGEVKNIQRTITRTISVSEDLPDAFSYALFGNNPNSNTLKLQHTAAITGNLYYNGDVTVDSGASITGLTYADSVSGDGTYTEAPGDPDPIPEYPDMETAYYDDLISTADADASSNLTVSGSNVFSLGGGTHYYKKVTVRNNAEIRGPGIIVAKQAVLIRNNGSITSDAKVVTKTNITFQNSATSDSGTYYARNAIQFKDIVSVQGSFMVPTDGKTLSVVDSASVSGLIYADTVKLRNDAVVVGSVVADSYTQNKITRQVSVTFNDAVLPDEPPEGMDAVYKITEDDDWREL